MPIYFIGTQNLSQSGNAKNIVEGDTVYVLSTGALLATGGDGINGLRACPRLKESDWGFPRCLGCDSLCLPIIGGNHGETTVC